MKIIHEIHRRSLWQVLGIYLVVGWIVLQVVDVLAQNMGLPEWVFPFAIVLLVIGLPIVLATAFVQEGLRSKEVGGEEIEARETPPPGSRNLLTWRNAFVGGLGAFALWGVVATCWMFFGPGVGPRATEASDLRSIAALPFTTVHTDEESLAFVAGIHDDLLTQLSKVDSLKVISRTSVMQYEGTTKTIPEIAGELGVATVLEGGVQKAGDRVRVNVQLIDAETDEHLWAETYDEELTAASVFAMQSDLAKKIAGALQATLTPEVEQRIEAQPTGSLEAFELYTRARYISESSRGTEREGLEAAKALLEAAIDADSTYAPAWAGLADMYIRLTTRTYLPINEGYAAARQAAEMGIRLDPDLADALVSRGYLLTVEGSYPEAELAFERALELNPGLPYAHRRYASLLTNLARHEEAVSEARRAVELDPLAIAYRYTLADALYWARDWDGTLAESRLIHELEPGDGYAYYNMGYALAMMGRHDEAIDALRRAIELDPEDPFNPMGLAWAYAHAGRQDEARAILEDAPDDPGLYAELAIVHGSLGDFDAAFEYLNKVADEDPGRLGLLRSDASADPLRADPRYDGLMARVGLE
jgi:TolB-like protein/Flp pilus assembly protein TadD